MQVRDLFNNGSAQEHGDSLSLKLQKGGSVPLQDSELKISYQFGEIFEVKERPLWRKVLRAVGVMLLRGTLNIVVGIDVPIPITKDDGHEIISYHLRIMHIPIINLVDELPIARLNINYHPIITSGIDQCFSN
ncbi:hypothetical protein ACH5RR_033940 [Cinchona calisaya]|uniref:Uncharacterized protein n=1 Tax=Cinchona calisaya TaxID=153742 RepID=A0ABD2YD93_9GENT